LPRTFAKDSRRSIEDAVGRADLLRRRTTGNPRADALELDSLLEPPGDGPLRYAEETRAAAEGGELDLRLSVDAARALREPRLIDRSYRIRNRDRAVGANLGGRLGRRFGADPPPGRVRARFDGAAGQSFGAFLARGVRLDLTGEANDYVGKGMSGGRIAIRPPAGDVGDPVLVGNTALYGATGGELFCAGRAGERFAVRNSGASAVIEGTGDHACEYMTGGTVVVLGDTGRNVAAGMTGGEIWVHDPRERLPGRLNVELVALERPGASELERARLLVARHESATGSPRGAALLAGWEKERRRWWRVSPRQDVARFERANEGTGARDIREPELSGMHA
jgi:glutamate synthase domain-containing protein 3